MLINSIGIAQSEDELGLFTIKTKAGYLFINNGKDKSFSIEINAKGVEPATGVEVPMFIINDEPVQILTVPLTNFAAKDNKLSDAQLLENHKIWESEYLGDEVYQSKLKVTSEKVLIGKRDFLFWGFVRPKFNTEYKQDYFITTILGNYLLAIGTTTKADKMENSKKTLTEIMNTLKVSDKPFDINKLSESIRNSQDK